MLVKIGPFEYRECPVLMLEPEDEQLVAQARAGIALPTTSERFHMPARYVEGMAFLAALKGGVDGD